MATLIYLLLVLAAIGIVYWAVQALNLPRPVYIIAVAVLAIVVLILVARLIVGIGAPVL